MSPALIELVFRWPKMCSAVASGHGAKKVSRKTRQTIHYLNPSNRASSLQVLRIESSFSLSFQLSRGTLATLVTNVRVRLQTFSAPSKPLRHETVIKMAPLKWLKLVKAIQIKSLFKNSSVILITLKYTPSWKSDIMFLITTKIQLERTL